MSLYLETRTRDLPGRSSAQLVEQRVIDVKDGEEPPVGAVPAPDGAKAHDWKEVKV